MSIFSKKNLKNTLGQLYARRVELDEQSAGFDGSNGELEVMAERVMITAVMDEFYKQHGVTAGTYYGLDKNKSDGAQEYSYRLDSNKIRMGGYLQSNRERGMVWL